MFLLSELVLRVLRRSESERAARGQSSVINHLGRLSRRARDTFLCTAKEKYPKERPPRLARRPPSVHWLWGPRFSTRLLPRGKAACIPACRPFRAHTQSQRTPGRAPRGFNFPNSTTATTTATATAKTTTTTATTAVVRCAHVCIEVPRNITARKA